MLLGDVFDFWRGRPAEAIRDSRYFFQKLSELNLKISYVIGNHDHHLAVMHQECQIIEKLAAGGWGGESYPIYHQSIRQFQSVHGLSLEMILSPFYSIGQGVTIGASSSRMVHLREHQTFSFLLMGP